ncbi:iron-sulfur cluster assembly scaffold protein [Candidatus Pacearchaeota archaeon]|nr:iron-sulfur cluster assembly scaffold protein [Candidatus Pacearchaeota archaeon]
MNEMNTHPDVKAKVDSQKWFYTKAVKSHFFSPKNFLDGKKADKYKADGLGLVGSPACGDMMKVWIKIDKKEDKIKEMKWQTFGSLLPGAKLLMEDFTTKKVEDLSLGDKVLDGESKTNIIEEVLTRDYSGKIISIALSTSNFYKFFLTPNHPVPCVRREKITKVDRSTANRWSEINNSKISSSCIELMPAAELKTGDFMIFNVPDKIKDNLEIDADICSILGYYVSDGSIPSKNRVIFYFGLNEGEFVEDIENIAKKRKWRYRIYKRNTENVLCIQLNEPLVVELLKRHGGAPSHKKFSDEVLYLPMHKQEKIINSYINGDGWVTQQKDSWQAQYFISTSKEELAYQLQIIIGRLGIFAPIHKREGREFVRRGKLYKNTGEYNLIFRRDPQYSRIKYHSKEKAFLIPISNVSAFDYSGKIYDPGLVYSPKIYKVNGISLHNCASAIASTSMLSVMVGEKGGTKIDDALKIKPQDIVKRLGDLPERKFHCSVLGDKALRAAINDYFRKSNQLDRMVNENARIIDKEIKVTDKDIEEAVLEGADTLEKVQHKLKVGIGNKSCIPEVEQLIKFYKEKYFG